MLRWRFKPLARGQSKAALTRRFVGERITPVPSITDDPLWQLVGTIEGDGNDSTSIDEVLYGQRPGA